MQHDRAYKLLFSYAEAMRDLLREFVAGQIAGGREWLEQLDLATLEKVPTEYVDPTFHGHSNDLVWRIRGKAATSQPEWVYVLVMVEFQSTVDRFMALRVQGYAVQLFNSLVQGRRVGQTGRLPVLLAVVVYNGRRRWGAAPSMAELIGPGLRPQPADPARGPDFAGERYVLVDVRSYRREALPGDNFMSLVVAAEQIEGAADAERVLRGALERLPREEQQQLLAAFLAWLRRLAERIEVDLDFTEDLERMKQIAQGTELRTTLEERFEARFAALRAEGAAHGRQEGIQEGLERERQLLLRQAGRKFGSDTADPVAGLLAAIDDPDRLQEIGEWIVDCDTGSEFLTRITRTH